MSKVTFNNKKKIFFNDLNKAVEQYFKEKGLKKTGNFSLYIKATILITLAVVTYVVLMIAGFNLTGILIFYCIFGIIQAGIGFNVMHDANHGSFSDRKWVNTLMGLTANMMGVNAWLWKQKHNIIHHTYTNINGMDNDIAKSPFLRMCPSQKQLKLHRYQFIYCVPLYALSSFMMIGSDFTKYFGKANLLNKQQKMKPNEHIIFWVSKTIYFIMFILIPVYFLGLLPAILGFILMHFMLGLTLSIVFQLAHVVEATHFLDASGSVLHIDDEWALHQVQTTADFATHNRFISWFTGGLNFQVEHHIFPMISHVHYPAIHQILKTACKKFSIQLNNYPSMSSAVASHFRFMKKLGSIQNN